MLRYHVYGSYCVFKGVDRASFTLTLAAKVKRFIGSFDIYPEVSPSYPGLPRGWGLRTPFTVSVIVRGIGYRLLLVENKDGSSSMEVGSRTEVLRFLADKEALYSAEETRSYGDTVIAKSPITNRPYTRWKRIHDNYYTERGEDSYLDDYRGFHDLGHARFLIVRVGDTTDTVIALPRHVNIKSHRKERKITIYGTNKEQVRTLARIVYSLRRPSPYTGRGVKYKHIRVRYKKVRKTKAGGRAF